MKIFLKRSDSMKIAGKQSGLQSWKSTGTLPQLTALNAQKLRKRSKPLAGMPYSSMSVVALNYLLHF